MYVGRSYGITVAHEDEEAEVRENGIPDPCWPELSKSISHSACEISIQACLWVASSRHVKSHFASVPPLLKLRKLFNIGGGKSCRRNRKESKINSAPGTIVTSPEEKGEAFALTVPRLPFSSPSTPMKSPDFTDGRLERSGSIHFPMINQVLY